jgi:membrane-bound lytic murein transglycosylase B
VLPTRLFLALFALLLSTAPHGAAPLPLDAHDPQSPNLSVPLPQVADVPKPPFAEWLADLRKEALSRGITEPTVEAALGGLEPLPIVVERDRTQAERVLPLDEYLKRRLNRKFVKTARERRRQQGPVLARVSARYGVPPGVLVAVWGLESNFGRFSGVRPTIASLATLAYDNRRAALFREELFDALRILDRGDVTVERMKGSWAGAMGQPQFMPSSYLRFARDFDGDGRPDIWRSLPDVFASIANFLKEQGWRAGGAWGRRVKVPAVSAAKLESVAPLRSSGCEAVRQMSEPLPLSRWRALGLKLQGREKSPPPSTPASLVRAGKNDFLVFDNYQALLQYNCAHAYALSVALLSDRLK